MPDEPEPRQYEREPVRVRAGSSARWLAIVAVMALGVGTIALAGTLVAPKAGSAEAPSAVAPSPDDAALPPLVIESTDFHANGGAAYYGIGGKLLRALGPVPTASPGP